MDHRPLLGGPGKCSHEEGREHRKRRAQRSKIIAPRRFTAVPAHRNQETWQELVWVGEVLGFTQLCDTESVSKMPEVSRKQSFTPAQAEICKFRSYSKAVT